MTTPPDGLRDTRAALYGRVSTTDQTAENQLDELRDYATARRWVVSEYVDVGVSGATDRRPALDRLIWDAKRRRVGRAGSAGGSIAWAGASSIS